MTQNLPHREEAFASFLMKIFACLSPAKWLRKNKHGYAHFAKTSCLL